MKKAKVFVSVLLSILTLISAITLSGCTPQVNIDFKECVSATFSGYNGEGRASIDVDNGYVLSLLKDMNSVSAMGLASTFTLGTVENNGELSNGDVIKIKIGTNDEALKKAGVTVSNTELEFTVDGLEEKSTLDVFSGVTIEVNGTSPYCTVSVNYDSDFSTINKYSFEVKSSDGEKKTYYKNGDNVIVSLSDTALATLQKSFIIDKTSCEYTIQADSTYILSPDDITADSTAAFQSTIDDYLNNGMKDMDLTTKCSIIAGLSGYNAGSLAAMSCSAEIKNPKIESAYVGIENENSGFGSTREKRYAYFFYNADISYHIIDFSKRIDESVNGILIVRVTDPIITADGNVTYSSIAIGARKDLQTAVGDKITEGFSQII